MSYRSNLLLRTFAVVPLAVVVCMVGCGGSSKAKVSGTVSFKGEKVKGGNVTFAPVAKGGNESGRPATGLIKDDGSYEVEGVVVGPNRVIFAASSGEDSTKAVALKPGETAPKAAFQGFTVKDEQVEVAAGSSTINIELVGPKK